MSLATEFQVDFPPWLLAVAEQVHRLIESEKATKWLRERIRAWYVDHQRDQARHEARDGRNAYRPALLLPAGDQSTLPECAAAVGAIHDRLFTGALLTNPWRDAADSDLADRKADAAFAVLKDRVGEIAATQQSVVEAALRKIRTALGTARRRKSRRAPKRKSGGARRARKREPGQPDAMALLRRYAPSGLAEMFGMDARTLRKWANGAKVRRARTGEKGFLYSLNDAQTLAHRISTQSTDTLHRQKAREFIKEHSGGGNITA